MTVGWGAHQHAFTAAVRRSGRSDRRRDLSAGQKKHKPLEPIHVHVSEGKKDWKREYERGKGSGASYKDFTSPFLCALFTNR